MADLIDVSKTIVSMITPVVYPDGTSQPSILGSGVDVILGDGFPIKHELDLTLNSGNCFVSVFPIEKAERNVTRFSKVFYEVSRLNQTLFLTTVGDTVSFSGTPIVGTTCFINSNYVSYFYTILENDTLLDIANNFASQIPTSYVDTLGNLIIPNAFSIKVDVNITGVVTKETKRQQKVFTISIWTNDYGKRVILGSAIGDFLSDFDRIVLPDNYYARFIYDSTWEDDSDQEHNLYRRDINYIVEYATTISKSAYSITDSFANVNN